MEWRTLLLIAAFCGALFQISSTQTRFEQDSIPDFRQGTQYPDRDEDEQCTPIKLRLSRNSQRFTATLVRNTNTRITYMNEDARFMTSRLKARLDILADWYFDTYRARLTVILAYAESTTVTDRTDSLHYEGRTARIRGTRRSHLSAILRQAVLYGFDWVIYADRNYCRVSVIPDVCQTNLDLLFLLDQSGSVGRSNHALALQFMQSVVNFFEVGVDATHVALFTFSSGARVDFLFDDYLTTSEVVSRIGATRYPGGWTHTALALILAQRAFNRPDLSAARPVTAGIPRVVVLITDGRSNHYSIDAPARNLLASGATVYTIGVGNVYAPELRQIASDPDEDHSFLLRSFTDAAAFVQLLSGSTCDTPAVIPPGETPETEVEEDDFKYFQVECGRFTDSVIIEQIDIVGHCAVYVSITVVNPGPINPTAVTLRNENANVNRRRIIVRVQSKRIVYVSIRGITRFLNRFQMVVWSMLFAEDEYMVNVGNGDPANTRVIDLDIMDANDNLYFFNITEGNSAGRFRIDPETGEIFLTEPLDITVQDNYELVVIAYLRTDDCQRGRTTVIVTVVAVNANSPTFVPTMPVNILETVPVNTDVVQVSATDPDFGSNGEIRYFITGGNTDNAFNINSVTGEITTATTLNHTSTPFYTLTIQARDRGSPRMTGTTTQRINIDDVNQIPFFLTQCAINNNCIFRVPEDMSLGLTNHQIVVRDPDSSSIPNGQLTLTLSPNTIFTVNNAGRISLRSALDRETQDRYVVNFAASDGGSPSLGISTTLTFIVTDVNDNRPLIFAPSTVNLSESIQVEDAAIQVASTDADRGVNRDVIYTLTGSDLFTIDRTGGAITLVRSLDYEVATKHEVTVVASNPDGLSSMPPHVIEIFVINENDNSPIFTMNPYTATVAENSDLGITATSVLANDADLEIPGEVRYSIVSGNVNNAFRIDEVGGTITVSGNSVIDRETISEYTLTVRARDRGNPSRTDRTIVRITIGDENDNAPVFQRSQYTLSIREDASVPSDHLTLVATDADKPGTPNSAITYSIVSGNTGGVFSLSGTSGVLSLQAPLDFETVQSYSLVVAATDGGSPRMNSTAMILVTVLNLNDEPPVLSGNQEIDLSESTATGVVVATFTVTQEMGDVLEFELSGDQHEVFSINSNGMVALVQSLDYEVIQQYVLTVTVSDGQMSDSSTLTVNVLDENDNAPVFITFGPFTIDEEEPQGTMVGTVVATDADSSNNGVVTYSSSPGGMFTITLTGQIRTAQQLDREVLGSSLSFTVTATDNGTPSLSTSVTVMVRLRDINDNAPEFVNPPSEIEVLEGTAVQSIISTIQATDNDIGNNAVIIFTITGSSLFDIDPSSGDIGLVGGLDYEMETEYAVTITAANPDGVSSNHSIRILVVDENDNSPVFSMDPYIAEVTENSANSVPVVMVLATDADSGMFGEVRYSIVSGNIDDVFSINSSSGAIIVNGSIDRETLDNYVLVVSATDLGTSKKRQTASRMSTASVRIRVLDENDNRPIFQQPQYSLSVREDTSTGNILTLIATDADEPNTLNSMVTYSITAGNDGSKFSLSSDGVLSLVSELDFETQRVYTVTVTAQDQGTPTQTSDPTTVTIMVININDEPPVISDNQVVSVSEGTELTTEIAMFNATGEDGETLVFSLTGDSTGTFNINAQSGVVTLAASLDFESRDSYILQVSVSDGLFSDSSTLTVNVLDENDNAPQIAPPGPFIISEEMPENTEVGMVVAFDIDSGENARLTFSFSDTNVYFNIDATTGVIRTVAVLDSETISAFSPPSFSETFTIRVVDGGSPSMSAEAQAVFTLRDINDNPPIIQPTTEVNVSEYATIGMEIATITATDADVDSINSQIEFSSTDASSSFTIDADTGVITVAQSLDFETSQSHIINITATDGLNTDTMVQIVDVIDENDNSPVFTLSTYTATILENNNINAMVTTVSASDADSHTGEFGKVVYTLQNGDDIFSIAPGTGIITADIMLDRETTAQHRLVVVATDYGIPARSSSAEVLVTVSDDNDNTPVFQQIPYMTGIREDADNQTDVITVIATDADEPGNVNSQIDYSLTNTSVFSISSDNGLIRLNSQLNFEEVSSYVLTVVATDRGSPSLSSSAEVTVIVFDVNDQPPVLSGDQTSNVSELTPVMSQIVQYNASGDSTDTFTYFLNGSQSNDFEIDSTTGVVTLVQPLDYETTMFYYLNVFVDDGSFVTVSELNITVLDENDNAPIFEPMNGLSIDEESSANTSVGSVSATDADSPPNAMITYSFVQPSTANFFTIDSDTGEILSANVLDREALAQQNLFTPPQSQMTFQVQATDSGTPSLFSLTDVLITLNDINDNAPVFINPPTEVDVLESVSSGHEVTVLTASDADIGANAMIIYSVSGSSLFNINMSTGVITLDGALDYETDTEYTVIVTAANPDGLFQTNHSITIRVLDVNDNSPIFTMDPSMASVEENSPVGTAVLNVSATDADSGALGEVRYSIGSDLDGDLFAIAATTGKITVRGSIDREVTAMLTFTVIATDLGSTPRSSMSTVNIMVTDINDNTPSFNNDTYGVDVSEADDGTTPLFQAIATDEDATAPNNQIMYSLSGPDSSRFDVAQDGFVSLVQGLDFETQQMYSFMILAVDGGNPLLTGTADIEITVLNQNDLAPELSGDDVVNISESAAVGSRVAQFTATGEEGETLTFSLNITNTFAIDDQSGLINLTAPLDFETIQSYTLQVTVNDGLFQDNNILRVNVLDENDNAPQITSAGPFMLNEEVPVNTSLGSVTAMDADSGENAVLTYSFPSSEITRYFSIDPNTGEVSVTSRIDRESFDRVNLPPNFVLTGTLQVTDNGSPALSVMSNVEFHINETNDNAPQLVNPVSQVDVRELTPVGELIVQLSASDNDVGGDPIIFSISGSPLFAINSTMGAITLNGNLDYETETEYIVSVMVANPDGLSSPAHSITINVIDENDNSPVFSMNPYTASVEENSATETIVVAVVATDEDSGTFGEVRYSIVSGNADDAFAINAVSGNITVSGSIDREALDIYELTVAATDIPGRSSQAIVNIMVDDVNDNAPIFNPPTYSEMLFENVSQNYLILTVTATDADIPPNSDITYMLPSDMASSPFSVAPNGSLFTASMLDFDTESTHTITILAVDGGDPSLNGSATVTISLLDVNDQPPSLNGITNVSVSELAAVGTGITQFRVTNVENGDTITFQLSGDMAEVFTIDQLTGSVTLAQMLDFESQQSYSLVVTANDGAFTNTINLYVNVIDENDNTPVFNQSGPFVIMEEMPMNSSVGVVVATDADSGDNGDLNYTIVTNVAGLFSIDVKSGEIRTTSVLDREELELMNIFIPPNSQVMITIQAEDNGSPSLFSQVQVTIQLLDINDNTPEFAPFDSQLSFPENIRLNSVILELLATDPDQGENGNVLYSISDESLPFSIDSTGIITTTTTLDRETVDVYMFQVVAADNGTSPRSSSMQVTINVTDINDNPPVFLDTPYGGTIPEDASSDGGVSIPLLTISTSDADIGVNADVTYSLGPDTSSQFSIEQSGRFLVSGSINFEEQNQFDVTVIATDGGIPALTSSTIVNVTIFDVNEFPLVFDGPCDADIPEDTSINTIVTQCTARDLDGVVFYQALTEGNNAFFTTFTLVFETGEVFLDRSLDREDISEYQFTVQAGTFTGISGFAEMLVTLTITDINDNAPVFNPDTYSVTYSDPQTQLLVTFNGVSDADINENGQFSLNIDTITRTNDSNGLDTHTIGINATDMGTPSMSGFATVEVNNGFPCQLMEFSLDEATRQLSVGTLCSIENPVSENYTFGTPVQLNCSAISNLPVTYQWQLNGSFITNQSSNPILDLGNVDFNDVGAYSCIARSSVGNIQSISAFISVHTVPVIVRHPEDEAVELDRLVLLRCTSTGVPVPQVTFYHNDAEATLNSRVVQIGQFLQITRVTRDDQGRYHCVASNDAGEVMSTTAVLVVFDDSELVTTTLFINNPNEDGTCHNLDVDMIEDILEESTGEGAEVTAVPLADGFCEPGPCYPNPCMNNGRCSLNENAAGGYECACPATFIGVDCQEDLDECATDNPCFTGTCTNTVGLFQCTCPENNTGHRCQYMISCNDTSCAEDETCVETVATINGFVCVPTTSGQRLSIQLSEGVSANQLDEALFDLTDQLQELDPNSTDICEPRFISAGGINNLTLVWGCPDGIDPLGANAEELICREFLNEGLITMCTLSDGTIAEPPKSELDPIGVSVTFILHDEVTFQPLTSSNALAVLQQSGTLSALQSGSTVTGVQACSFEAGADADTNLASNGCPATSTDDDDSGLSGGAIAGIVIAILAVLVVLALLGAYVGIKYYRKNNEYGVEQPKTASALRAEGGTFRRQTVVGQFDNPAFTKETATRDDTAFENPNYVDAPVITKLEGVTKPVEKSAITRITSEDGTRSVSSETVLLS